LKIKEIAQIYDHLEKKQQRGYFLELGFEKK